MRTLFEILGVTAIGYCLALNLTYLIFTVISWRDLASHMRRRPFEAVDDALTSPFAPPISILVPAYNEEAGIVESVHSLLTLRYPQHEVVVVSDGSTDGTIRQLTAAYDLVPVRLALRDSVEHRPITASWVSRKDPRLVVIEKLNGGKSDSLNCGVVAARYPYVCAIDADTMLEPDALLKVAKPVLEDPKRVVATGGIVRIANGCKIERGAVTEVGLPKSRLATLQVLEYFRAFLVGRVAWSRMRSLPLISGAFGLFKRSAVEEVGGWWTDTVGEDAELVFRLHRHMRERDQDYRIEFVPDPVCWTEAPEDIRTLSRQRRRWQRGLGQTLGRHRSLTANPRYGMLGMVAIPYFWFFELIGPIFIATGYVTIPFAAALGILDLNFLIAFLLASVAFGVLLSIAALVLEEVSFRRHDPHRDAARLFLYAVIDNFGYRQLQELFRLLGTIDLLRGTSGWGEMKRKGIGQVDAAPAAGAGAQIPTAATPAASVK
jgi:cellulose synthase/poly-beta-1,6-N-acetylglucosamine synthase-like glycosyltransferase